MDLLFGRGRQRLGGGGHRAGARRGQRVVRRHVGGNTVGSAALALGPGTWPSWSKSTWSALYEAASSSWVLHAATMSRTATFAASAGIAVMDSRTPSGKLSLFVRVVRF